MLVQQLVAALRPEIVLWSVLIAHAFPALGRVGDLLVVAGERVGQFERKPIVHEGAQLQVFAVAE